MLKAEADRQRNAERIVLSLELGNLKRAMDRGGSYAAELAEVRKVAGNRIDLATLQRYQDDGVPTLAELARQFRPLTSAIIDADAEQQDASVVDRLLSGAKTIVRVRKLTPDAGRRLRSRRRSRAWRSRSVTAASATCWRPPRRCRPRPSRRPTRTWLDKVEARQAVETAMAAIDRQLKSSLGAAPPRARSRPRTASNDPPHPVSRRRWRSGDRTAWLADRPGQMLLNWQGYEIETTVFRAVVIFAFLIGLAVFLWSLLRQLWTSPAAVGRFINRRRQERGLEALSSGMIAIGAGDRSQAMRYAMQARKALPNEPLTHLLRAQAAQLSGDRATARRIFEAMLGSQETEQLGLRGLFLEAEREGEHEAARQFAERALRLNPQARLAGRRAVRAAVQGRATGPARWRRWRPRKRNGHFEKAVADRRRAVLLTAQAQAARRHERRQGARARHGGAQSRARPRPKPPPSPDACSPRAARRPRPPRHRADVEARAASRSRHCLRLCPPRRQPARPAGARQEPRRARRRTPSRRRSRSPRRPSRRTTGRRRARPSRHCSKAGSSQRVCTLMARIEGEQFGNAGRVREWLARAANAPRDPAWTADGFVSDRWAAVSPVTGALDAFQWKVPVEQSGTHDEELALAKLEELIALGTRER